MSWSHALDEHNRDTRHAGDPGSIHGNGDFNFIFIVLTVDSGEPVVLVVWVQSATTLV